MAIRKAGSRRIVVDGATYLWRFPKRPTQNQEDGWPGVMVTVSPEDVTGALLVVEFPHRFILSGPVGQIPPRPVLPSDVAAGVRAAIEAGWVANKPGKQFVLRVAEEDA